MGERERGLCVSVCAGGGSIPFGDKSLYPAVGTIWLSMKGDRKRNKPRKFVSGDSVLLEHGLILGIFLPGCTWQSHVMPPPCYIGIFCIPVHETNTDSCPSSSSLRQIPNHSAFSSMVKSFTNNAHRRSGNSQSFRKMPVLSQFW